MRGKQSRILSVDLAFCGHPFAFARGSEGIRRTIIYVHLDLTKSIKRYGMKSVTDFLIADFVRYPYASIAELVTQHKNRLVTQKYATDNLPTDLNCYSRYNYTNTKYTELLFCCCLCLYYIII